MTFRSIELTNEEVRIYGTVGILTGDSDIVAVRDGKESKTQLLLVAVYAEQDGNIKLIHFQSSPVPK